MNIVDSLVVTLGLDTTALKQGAKEATAVTAKLSTDMVGAADKGEKAQTEAASGIVKALQWIAQTTGKTADASVKASKQVAAAHKETANSVEGLIRSIGALYLMMAGASSIKSFVSDMIGLDAAVGRVAHNTRTTTEFISGLGRAAEQVGGSFDGAVSGLRGFADAYQQLRLTGQSGVLDPIARLQALSGKRITLGADVQKTTRQIADALQALDQKGNAASANYLGRQIFHDDALVNTLMKGGARGVDQATAQSSVTKKEADAAAELQKNLAQVRQQFIDVGNSILMDFGPAMVSGIKWLKDLIGNNKELIEQKVKEWVAEVGKWFSDHESDIRSFGEAMLTLTTAAAGIATAFSSQSPMVQALEAFSLVALRVLGPVTSLVIQLKALAGIAITGALTKFLSDNTIDPNRDWDNETPGERTLRNLDEGLADRVYGKRGEQLVHGPHHGLGVQGSKDDRTLWQKYAPKVLGGKDAPSGDSGPGAGVNGVSPDTRLSDLDAHQRDDLISALGKSEGNPGARPDYNNPGNIKWGAWARSHGATGGGIAGIAQFPDAATGHAALESLLFNGKRYRGRTIREAMNIYSPRGDGANDPDRKAEFIAKRIGAPSPPGTAAATAQPAIVPPPQGQNDVPDVAGDISGMSTYNHGQLREIKGLIFHHTAGRGTPEDIVNILNQRKLGVQYVIGRDGKLYRTLPNGRRGAHILPSRINDLNNSNSMGVEVIAKDDSDVTPAQIAAGKAFGEAMARRYPGLQIFGHGEVNPGHRPASEGMSIVSAIRADLGKPQVDPNYKPAPIPLGQRTLQTYMGRDSEPHTLDHAAKKVLQVLAHARALTHHGDAPVPVVLSDKSGRDMLQDRGAGAHIARLKHQIHRMQGPRASLDHYGRMMAMASMGGSVIHHADNRSDTRINTLNVHTRATDAKAIAADIEPHLRRGSNAGRADYGLG